tara:strand:+ start:2326 stop:3225 length:900 start_codon:yes stop_codon:yes gene_type:complete
MTAFTIGIISKKDHCKSHVAALKKRGYRVRVLGDRPTKVPSSIDLLMCRTLSCSHLGSDVALAHKRAGYPVLMANSVTKLLRYLEGLNMEKDWSNATGRELVEETLRVLGFFAPALTRKDPEEIALWAESLGVNMPRKETERLFRKLLKGFSRFKYASISKASSVLRSKYSTAIVYGLNKRGMAYEVGILLQKEGTKPAVLSAISDFLGYTTEPQGSVGGMKVKPVVSEPASNPPEEVVTAPEPVVSAVPKKQSQDDSLSAAIRLLQEEMEKSGVTELSIDGRDITYRRVEVRSGTWEL